METALLERQFPARFHIRCFRSPTSDILIKKRTWNATTMLQTLKLKNVKIEMYRQNIEILGLSETRWNGNGDFRSDKYRIIYSGKQSGKAGVALV